MRVDDILVERMQEVAKTMSWWQENKHHYEAVLTELEAYGADARPSLSGIDISMSGGKAEITGLFRILRKHGFAPTHRPQPKESYYSAFFYPEVGDFRPLWLMFSSNVCKRVQVGTKMEEVPVYEIQCAESMEVDDETA